MSSIKPIKTLLMTSITLNPLAFWPEDEGTYYGEDQWWAGGPAPQPVTFILEGIITQQNHSSFSTPQPYIYNALDINVGDWYVEIATGKSLQITSIDTGVTNSSYIKCTISDIDRWEQFSSQDGISATGANGFIVSLDNTGMPVFDNLIAYNDNIAPNFGFVEDVLGRFRQRNLVTSNIRVNQPGHTFAIGDSIILQNDGTFALADATSQATENVIGLVTDTGIPGLNWFNYEPRGKLEINLDPALPGLPGDMIWLDPANPGKLTAIKPVSLAVAIFIKITDTTGIKLYGGGGGADFGPTGPAGPAGPIGPTGTTGPTGVIQGQVFNNIAERDAYSPTIGQFVYVLNDGTGFNAAYIAAQVSPTIWISVNIGPNGNNVGNPSAGDKRYINTVTANIDYNSPSPLFVANLAANTSVISVDVVVITAFDGSATVIEVGSDSVHNLFMSSSMIYTDEVATYINGSKHTLSEFTAAKIFINQDGSTQGDAQVTITYQ